MKKLALFLLFFSLSIGQVSAKKYYKWTDADGNIHYSENNSANKNADKIRVYEGGSTRHTTTNDASDEAKSTQEEKTDTDEVAKANEEIQKQNDAIRKKNCKTAKDNLAKLLKADNHPVTKKNSKTGKIENLSKSSQKQLIRSNRQAIKEYCQ